MHDRLILPRPDDFHVHLRQGPQLSTWTRIEASSFGRAMVMPNTLPPVSNASTLVRYRNEIRMCLGGNWAGFEPLMTFKVLPGMSAETVRECAGAGAIAGKYYPEGATTNSGDGLSSPDLAVEALGEMERLGIVLSIHAEDPVAPALQRELAFLPILAYILERYPRLRVVFEHISSREGIGFLLAGPDRLGGTVTAHHLLFTLDDLAGDSLNPHLYCKPILKNDTDREALRNAVFGGCPRLFFGSDSAPHARTRKECPRAASGIFAAPTAVPALAGLFEDSGAEDALVPFMSRNGAVFYGLPPPVGELALVREEWIVPEELDGVVPMFAGRVLRWNIVPAPE